MQATANLEALRAAAVVVLGADHRAVKAITRANEAHDRFVSRWALDQVRRLPRHEVRAIVALPNARPWHCRQAEAALGVQTLTPTVR
jgi:hypothetical protein